MRILFMPLLLLVAPFTWAMDYGQADRESTNIEDRRPAGEAAQRCEQAYRELKTVCITNMDGVSVAEASSFSGHQQGVSLGLANIESARTDIRSRFNRCLAYYAETRDVCDKAYQEASQVPTATYEVEQIRKTASESTNVYNTGQRKYDKTLSSLSNTQIQLQKIGDLTK